MHIPPACFTCGDPTIGAVGPVFMLWRQHVMAQHLVASGTHPSHALTDARLRPRCLEGLLPDYGGFTPARRVRTEIGKIPTKGGAAKESATAAKKSASAAKKGAAAKKAPKGKKTPDEPSPTDTPAERAAAIFPDIAPLEPIYDALGIDAPCCRMCISSAIPLELVL